MKKIMNTADQFVDEALEGIICTHWDALKFTQHDRRGVVRRHAPAKGKVAIATGGGAGHLPLFLGYVGEGLADGVSVGNVFTSPSADTMYEVAREIEGGEGVLFLYGNYFGDKMNFEVAKDMLEDEDIKTESVIISDDIASASRDKWQERRGVAGLYFAYKIAGAAAAKGHSLKEIKRVTEKAAENLATMGVAISPCTIPESGRSTFEIGENEMEIGMGIHGEPGIERDTLQTAREITKQIVDRLLSDINVRAEEEVAVLINGAGATPLEELYIVANETNKLLHSYEISFYSMKVGEYATSLEMGGCSISMCKVDEELKELLEAGAYSPFIRHEEGGSK
ncbi:dihydroxyacetone kinase subunit DhaK [Salibacterium aidingense]|uniref:dihydroxyacetone kinase subunit DhaK n=1 Tax=Salibacterium aidingense TaxID=384933 RepID=UPI003BC19C8B